MTHNDSRYRDEHLLCIADHARLTGHVSASEARQLIAGIQRLISAVASAGTLRDRAQMRSSRARNAAMELRKRPAVTGTEAADLIDAALDGPGLSTSGGAPSCLSAALTCLRG